MVPHPSIPALYKRVRYLTNIGEHAEAAALSNDLQARRLKETDKHAISSREA